MAEEPTERCIGCGATVPRIDGPVHRYMTSVPGCWALFGELNARYLADQSHALYRQLCADTYAVQHPGSPNVPQAIQSVAGHLMSLYAQLELGIPTEQIPIHIGPALWPHAKDQYFWLTPPSFDNVKTIVSMLSAQSDPVIAAREWAESAWHAWSPHHAQVRAWYDTIIGAVWGRTGR